MKIGVRVTWFLSCLFGISLGTLAQNAPQLELLPANPWDSDETHQVVWETKPGVRYELQESGSLTNWAAVAGYPAAATQYADAYVFNASNEQASARFFKVVEFDEQPPSIYDVVPGDAAFAIPRFSTISLKLSDVSGVDPSSIAISVGDLGTFTLSDAQLSYTNGVLTFDNGGDVALGYYGTNVQVSLVAADINGYATTNRWEFRLELEAQTAGDVFVLGSPEAQRAGQQLTTEQRMVFSAVYPVAGPIRMSSGAAPWTLVEVGDDYVVFDYADTPPTFQIDQFLANAAPGKADEIFYRKVVSVSNDSGAKRITVQTVDVSLMDMLAVASLALTNPSAAVWKILDDGLMVQSSVDFPMGNDFNEDIDFGGSPVNFNLQGEWSFVPSLTVAFDIQGSELENFFMRFEGNSSIRIEPTITASGSFSKTVTTDPPILHAWNVYYLGQAGPVPIWVDVNFDLNAEAGVEINASGYFHTAIERDRTFYVQVQYSSTDPRNNGWSKSPKESGLAVDPFEYQITGHGKAWARLVPQVDLRLESLFGVYANLEAEVGLEGDASFSGTTPLTADFDLWGTLDLNAGMSVIGINADYLPQFDSYRFIDYRWSYLYAPAPAPLQFTDHPDSTSAYVGENAVFSSLATAGSAISYQWYHNNIQMSGKSSRTLQLNGVTTADAGSYFVRAKTATETKYSNTATLTVSQNSGMVRIPGGTNSGTDPGIGFYSLTVSTFYMDKTEVTKAQWDTVHNWAIEHGYSFDHAGSGKASNHPVHTVNWYDCVKWCNARSQLEGKTPCYTVGGSTYKTGQSAPDCNLSANGHRLPTSAEWEYAARGSYSSRRFPWGDTIQHTKANYYSSTSHSYDTSSTRGYHPSYDEGGYPYTSPVGSFSSNGFGLYDMSGNVWEWCWDSSGSNRNVRGASWSGSAHYARCGSANWYYPDSAFTYFGFRSVCR